MRGLAVVLPVILWCGCSDLGSDPDPRLPLKDQPNQEGWYSTVCISTNGITDAYIKYGHVMRWENRQMTTFNSGLQVDFFEDGQHSAVLTADSGEIRGNSNNLSAFGHVVILSDSGLSMRTDMIYWDYQKQKVFADGFVTLTSAEDTLNGYAFESNKDLTSWKMKNAFGQSGRDIDLRTGTVRSSRSTSSQDHELEKEMEHILKEPK